MRRTVIPLVPARDAPPTVRVTGSSAPGSQSLAATGFGSTRTSGGGQRPLQPPLSLYIHVPWCVRKCPYCDFNSHAVDPQRALPEDAYLAALRADLEASLPAVWGRPVHTVFIGGGTPSLLSGAGVARLLSDVRALLPLAPDCEITLEANPGTFETGRYAQFRAAGVNRLSIGVQSFDDAKLAALGRVHDGTQAVQAVAEAQRVFDNFNIDLMIGLPGQSAGDALRDVEQALRFAPPHLSLYQLTLEPNTVFHKYPPVLPDEDVLEAIGRDVEARVTASGYEHYEVSAFCRPGRASRHNRNYWTFGDYLGVGAGAHGKLSLAEGIVRTERFRQPESYLAQAAQGRFESGRRLLLPEDLGFEFMLNALRLNEGFGPGLFAQRTGRPLADIEPVLRAAQARGLLHVGPERIAPTALGQRFLNDLQAMFLVDPV